MSGDSFTSVRSHSAVAYPQPQFSPNHSDIAILDSTMFGLGRGGGNLPTEVLPWLFPSRFSNREDVKGSSLFGVGGLKGNGYRTC